MIVFPLTQDPLQDFDLHLSDILYHFELRWIDACQSWLLSMFDAYRGPIFYNYRLSGNWSVTATSSDPRLPPGDIVCVDVTGQGKEPTFENLGIDLQVIYRDGTE